MHVFRKLKVIIFVLMVLATVNIGLGAGLYYLQNNPIERSIDSKSDFANDEHPIFDYELYKEFSYTKYDLLVTLFILGTSSVMLFSLWYGLHSVSDIRDFYTLANGLGPLANSDNLNKIGIMLVEHPSNKVVFVNEAIVKQLKLDSYKQIVGTNISKYIDSTDNDIVKIFSRKLFTGISKPKTYQFNKGQDNKAVVSIVPIFGDNENEPELIHYTFYCASQATL